MTDQKSLDVNDLMPDPELLKEQENLDRIYKNWEKDVGVPLTAQSEDPALPGYVRYIGEAPKEGARPLK